MSEAKVEVDVNEMGMGSIKVNGRDMSGLVRGVEVQTSAGSLNRVELYLSVVDVTMTGEADVRVVIGGEEFSWEDVGCLEGAVVPDAKRGVFANREKIADLANRLASVLPPREKP